MADYREQVTQAAKEAGLDPDFVTRLVAAESNWNPEALSKRGAMGLMQLMPATAKQYGVTNLHDPAQNIRGGVAYLKALSQKYPGRPDLVAAAYNAGPGNVDKAGGVPDFPETKAYVEKVDPFAKWRSGEAQQPAATGEDPFAKWRTTSTEQVKAAPAPAAPAPTGGDEIVGMRTDPQARAERINQNLEEQQANTRATLLGLPGMGQAIGATLRGAGTATQYLGRAAEAVPWYAREIGAHLTGLGTPGYIAAAIGPKAVQLAGRATSAVGRVIPKMGWGSTLGVAAEEVAPAAEAVASKAEIAGAGPGGRGWYKPWEGAERERILGGKPTAAPKPSPIPKTTAPTEAAPVTTSGQPPLTKVWVAMNKIGTRLKATEMPRATELVKGGMDPAEAVRKVVAERGGGSAAEELAKQLGTPSDAEVAADMGKRARSGQKTLMGRYGDR